jgi:hypothetical protein
MGAGLFTSKTPLCSIKRMSHYGTKGNAAIAAGDGGGDCTHFPVIAPQCAAPA